jgi:hypothetical protein
MLQRPGRSSLLHGGKKLAAVWIIPFLAPWLFSNCRSKTDKEIIAAMIERMASQVEKKDGAGLIAHLAGDYRDMAGRDCAQTEAMLQEYFGRYRGIVVKVLTSRITLRSSRQAAVETDVALYSGAAAAFRKLVGFSGENYRFRCLVRKNGEWLIAEAGWEYIPLESLFPESLKILREIFPDL